MSLYNYYVPIQIWETNDENYGKLYRFHIIQNDNDFKIPKNLKKFYPPEWDNLKNWQNIWKLKNIIYGYSPMYRGYLNRGYVMINIYNNQVSPYNSIKIETNNTKHLLSLKSSFITMLYPFLEINDNFSIMYISLKATIIQDVKIYNQKNKDTKYNFLSNSVKKWDENFFPFNNNLILYIFQTIPNFTHWKINSENICIPSNDKNDFPTLLTCNLNNNPVKNKYTFVQNNSQPVSEIFLNKDKTNLIIFLFIFFFLCVILIIFNKRFST